MSTIDWSKAPEWANAVISSKDGQEFYVSQFGGISARQRVGYCEVDNDHSADMIIPHDWSLVATRRAPWSGEGLPPVGIEFEYTTNAGYNWHRGSMLFSDSQVVLLNGYHLFKIVDPDIAFRPIRTPEQIASEEREHNVRNACTAIAKALAELHESEEPTAVAIIEAMIDAGYSKQVMP